MMEKLKILSYTFVKYVTLNFPPKIELEEVDTFNNQKWVLF